MSPVNKIYKRALKFNDMKRLLFVLAIMALGFSLNAWESSITVSGYISTQEEDPISGVTISSSTSGVSSSSSDKEGFYSISVPANRQCTLTFSHPDYQSESRTVNSSSNISDLNITMYE